MNKTISTGAALLSPSIANSWFGPGYPIPAVAPEGTEPRTRNYQYNTNIRYLPQKEFSYKQLRALGDSNYLFRVILERFKSRISSHEWEIRLKPEPGEPKDSVSNRSWGDSRVKKLTALFNRPDGEHDWQQWANAWLEDNLVIDAVAIWADRSSKKQIGRLIQLDGSTISRVIDANAMTPMPPYVAYRQLVHDLPAVNLMFDDLQYTIENYRAHREFGFSQVEYLALLGTTQINRAIWTLNHYTEGNIPEAYFIFDDEKYTSAQIKELIQNVESKLNGQIGQRQRLFPMPAGKIQEMRGAELFDAFDEFLARVFAYSIGEPVTALVKGNNRAEAQQIDDTREESGEVPKLKFFAARMSDIIQSEFFFGFDDLEFCWRENQTTDALTQAQIDFINVPLGITTVDEARARDGKAPLTPEQLQAIQDMKAPPAPPPGEDDDEDEPPAPGAKTQKKKTRSALSSLPGGKLKDWMRAYQY